MRKKNEFPYCSEREEILTMSKMFKLQLVRDLLFLSFKPQR